MSANVSKLNEWTGRCCMQGIEVYRLEYVTDGTGLYMTKKKSVMEYLATVGLHQYTMFG